LTSEKNNDMKAPKWISIGIWRQLQESKMDRFFRLNLWAYIDFEIETLLIKAKLATFRNNISAIQCKECKW